MYIEKWESDTELGFDTQQHSIGREVWQELWNKYNVIYNGGLHALMIVPPTKYYNDYTVIVGYAEDGAITFHKDEDGYWQEYFNWEWCESFSQALREADKIIRKQRKE